MTAEEENFGAAVRRLREEREIGLRQFAKMIGVSATYLSKIEREELPRPCRGVGGNWLRRRRFRLARPRRNLRHDGGYVSRGHVAIALRWQ
jgi:hypothetical protein